MESILGELVVQIAAILLATMIMVGTFVIVFFKKNGNVERGHLVMFLIGFMCFTIALKWVPAEISLSKDTKIVFTTAVEKVRVEAKEKIEKVSKEKEKALIEAKAVKEVLAKEVLSKNKEKRDDEMISDLIQ